MSQLLLEQELLHFHTLGALPAPGVWIQASEWFFFFFGWDWLEMWPQAGAFPVFQCFFFNLGAVSQAGFSWWSC